MLKLGDLFLHQNPIRVYVSHFPGQMLGCAFVHIVKLKFLLFTPWEFFIAALADGLSLEFE